VNFFRFGNYKVKIFYLLYFEKIAIAAQNSFFLALRGSPPFDGSQHATL